MIEFIIKQSFKVESCRGTEVDVAHIAVLFGVHLQLGINFSTGFGAKQLDSPLILFQIQGEGCLHRQNSTIIIAEAKSSTLKITASSEVEAR